MGALEGPITYTTFYIQDEPSRDILNIVREGLKRDRFIDINHDLDQEESQGWTTIQNPLDVDFQNNPITIGQFIVASLRHDQIRLPATSVKLKLAKACEELRQKLGKEKLSKGEVEEVKERLERTLRRQALPRVKTYDMVWDTESRMVRFWSNSKKTIERFTGIFEDSFGYTLLEKCPYSELEHAQRMSLALVDESLLDVVVELEPAVLSLPPGMQMPRKR